MIFPAFTLPASNGTTVSDRDFQTGTTVLYLYPKDSTPGCTIEAQDFRDLAADFQRIGVAIFGLSKDSLKAHESFCTKYTLNFPLLSDEDHTLIKALGAWKEKTRFGKKYFGTERSTFIICNGEIVHEWRAVKVTGHATEVLKFCQSL